MTILQAILLASVWGASGFIIGKFTERVQWNSLIKRGVIRKPF